MSAFKNMMFGIVSVVVCLVVLLLCFVETHGASTGAPILTARACFGRVSMCRKSCWFTGDYAMFVFCYASCLFSENALRPNGNTIFADQSILGRVSMSRKQFVLLRFLHFVCFLFFVCFCLCF